MKRHPVLHTVHVSCAACGASMSIRSTAATLSVDVCSSCHPAYTGHERPLAAGSRVERFNKRAARATAA
jgi:large subunit ribosomal protein L31